MSIKDLSVVIPAYNERERLKGSLPALAAEIAARGRVKEVIVVDDGSCDGTAALAEELGRQLGLPLRVLRQERNRGKGAAVRAGMLAATGEYLLFSDADFSTPFREVDKLAARLERGVEVAIGSRALPEAQIVIHQPRFRELAGKIFNLLMRLMTGLPLHDTQCGFKLFTRAAAQAVFSRQTLDGFGFDVEILFLARRLGFGIAEVPVVWYNSPATKVHILRDSAQMFLDLLRIRWRHRGLGPGRETADAGAGGRKT